MVPKSTFSCSAIQYKDIFKVVKMKKKSVGNFDIFLIFAQNIRLWVHVRTASPNNKKNRVPRIESHDL